MRKDISFNFKPHPLTGDLVVKTGKLAIQQALVNIVRTNAYERGFNVEVMTNIDFSLFENITLLTGKQLKDNITNAIQNFEPGVELQDVQVFESADNELSINIIYNEANNTNTDELVIALRRAR